MVKKALWLVLLVGALLLVGNVASSIAEEKVIINGIDANFPPFAFVDKTGKPDGFDVAVVDWIAKDKGFKVEHQPMDWDGIIPSLNAKKIDMIASGMSISDARKEQVNFSDSLLEDRPGAGGKSRARRDSGSGHEGWQQNRGAAGDYGSQMD